MGYKALLTLDIENGVSSEKREKFYEYLKKEKWTKLSGLTTSWKFSFNDDVTRESAIRIVKSDVAGAARHAGVPSYNAAVQVGKGDIEKF
ncbi:hypothetical protein [Aidingimonas lacisalsi]|uniref:hypothetical protein n=1 Tax=Aidingimonas lacisalsi TaxID=2604086 RepID=UPI0011D2AF6F|nr:hypothetical protein [Aidingimonas lacisalsi]